MYKQSLTIPRWKRILRKTASIVAAITMVLNFGAANALFVPLSAQAAATTLSTTIMSWNILGVDSNAPKTAGPHEFLVQARVANTGAAPATNVFTNFTWGSGTASNYLSLLSNPNQPLNSINAGTYKDVFYVVKVTPKQSGTNNGDNPSNAVFDTSRPFTVTTTSPDASTTTAGQSLYIEHILSQSRNHVLNSSVVPPNPLVGEPFTVHVEYETASLYNHITPQMTYNPGVATLDSVETEYVTDGGTESDIYAVNHGNIVHSDFHFRANAAGSLNFFYTVLDNSGSSYHYNADFSNAIIVPVDPRQNLEKSVNKATALPGDSLTYTLEYFNTGNIDLQNVVITETYDSNFAFGSAVPSPSSGNNVWNIGTLPVAAGGSITINGTLTGIFPSGTTNVHNKASMSTTTPNVPKLYATADTTVTTACQLVATKTVDKTTTNPGDVLTYTITYENTGTAFCTGGGVLIFDEFKNDTGKPGLTYIANSAHLESIINDTDLHAGDPAPEIWGDTFNGSTYKTLGNLHEIGPGEKGVIDLQATVNNGSICDQWDVWNKGWTNGNEPESDVQFQSEKTHITTPCNGTLKVTKIVDVGSLTPDNWNFTTNGQTLTPAQGEDFVIFDLPAGTYTVTESSVAGYHQVSSTCSNVQIVPNQQTSCVIHNAQDRGELTVVKIVDGSQAPSSNFTMNVSGATPLSFPGDANGTTNEVIAGSYMVMETGPTADYTLAYSGDCDANGNVTVSDGEHKTCTLTNTRDTATVEVHKAYDYNGDGIVDQTDPENWTWNIDGDEQNIPAGAIRSILTNTAYTFSENALQDYNSTWICSINGQEVDNGSGVQTDELTVQKDDHIVCVFNNVRKVGTLRVIKEVVNDNGGNAGANDFTLYVKQNDADVLGSPFVGNETGTVFTLLTGEYQVSEDLLFGYVQTSLVCDGQSTSTVVVTDNTEKVCTITNNDIAPTITLIKNVINDNGGNAQPNDFNLTIGGNPVTSGVANPLDANTAYALNETVLPGYVFVSLTGDAKCPQVLGGEVTLNEGENITCAITNNDIAPSITLVKEVINNNGGNAGANDFGLTIGGTPVTSGQTLEVNANSPYSLHEAGLSGYSFVSLTGEGCPAELGGTVTLDEGEHITCTITNDDIAPKLKLNKTVINDNGGILEVSNFPLFIDQTQVTSGQWNTVSANTLYNVSELTDNGYAASNWGGDCSENGTITLQPGEEKTCTITNNDIPGKISGHKYDQSEKGLEGWEICLNESTCTTTDGNGYYEFNDVPAGIHTVEEILQYGWQTVDPISGEYDDVVVALNETTTVNFVNTLNEFDVSIDKIADESVEAGAEMTYTLNWEVTGNTPVYDVMIHDALPANTTYVSSSNGGTEFGGVVTWNIGDLVPDQSGQVTVTVLVATPLADGTELFNDAQICGTSYTRTVQEVIEHCDDDTTTTIVHSTPILDVEKSNDMPVAEPGDTVHYTITWSVDGNSKATDVTLVDAIPDEIIVDVSSISDGGLYDNATRTITWDLGTRVPHADGTVTYSGSIVSPLANETTIINVVKMRSVETDPSFIQDDSETVVTSAPTLNIVKTVDVGNTLGFVNPGDTVKYTVVVSNTGTDTAYDVVLTDTLPDGFLYAETLTPTRTWDLGDIAANDSVTKTYDVIIGTTVTAGFYDNIAVAVAENHDEISDDATVEVRVPTPQGDETKPELTIDKTVNVEFVNEGDSVTYTVVVKNIGDGAALNVTLTDSLPAGFTFEDGTKTKTWALGTIMPNASQTIVYNVNIGEDLEPGQYLNLAVAKADNHDEVTDVAPVEVRTPRVLGDTVPKTGASAKDLVVFLASLLFIVAGALFIREGRRVTAEKS